jgi:hypothetical protein
MQGSLVLPGPVWCTGMHACIDMRKLHEDACVSVLACQDDTVAVHIAGCTAH